MTDVDMRVLAEWTFEIRVQGPFLTQSSEPGPWGIDLVSARDALGRLYLPGPQVRGRLREALDEIGGEDPFERSRAHDLKTSSDRKERGNKEHGAEADEGPSRYPVVFSDFIAAGHFPAPGDQVIARTAIEAETHAAQPGSLRVADCPVQPGAIVTLRGTVRFASADEEQNRTRALALERALNWVPAWGSGKSVGMGRSLGASALGWKDHGFWLDGPRQEHGGETMATVEWMLQDPICLPTAAVKGNIFETESDLRGEVLKGAVAQSLRDMLGLDPSADLQTTQDAGPFAALRKHFSAIRFTTARPSNDHGAEIRRRRPDSLGVAHGRVYDFALVDEWDEANFAPRIAGEPVAFRHDWKPSDLEAIERLFPEPHLQRELRVRTAVNSSARRAEEQQLFAYRMVRPEGVAWRGTISFSHTDSSIQAAVWEDLRQVLEMGWIHIGKTKARARGSLIGWLDADELSQAALDPERWLFPDHYVITLQSPALLLDPLRLLDADGCLVARDDLDRLYAEAWNELSGDSLELVRRFTTHRLIGGYQSYRFRRLADRPHKTYYPALATEPGSVFVLRRKSQQAAAAAVRRWIAHGLDPQWVYAAYGKTFATNPYLPTNGYGEIAVNLDCHVHLRPTAAQLR